MSGIFGIWDRSGAPVDPVALDAMGATLAHRGPNGTGIWAAGEVAFGQQAHWTTPEEVGVRQPLGLSRATGRVGDPLEVEADLVLVADARLDNRDEVRSALRLSDRPAAELSDSELILRAYAEWGERAPERLLGAFAVAIWDGRAEALFLARDQMGVRPLYTHAAPDGFLAFGSEVKSLLELDRVPDTLDELAVARTLFVPVELDPTRTMYRAVRAHPRAQYASVSRRAERSGEYWALDPEPTTRLHSDAAYSEALLDAFETAVGRCVRTHLPVASMVSGGLDSSSVACVADRILRRSGGQERLITLSAVFDSSSRSDEREYSQAVVDHLGSDAEWFVADSVSPVDQGTRLERIFDGPALAGNLFLVLELYGRAAARGAGVVLSGYDGDTTVSHGVGRLLELADQRRWITLFQEVKGFAHSCSEPWVPAVWSWFRQYGLVPVARRLRGLPPPLAGQRGEEAREAVALSDRPNRDWSRGLAPEFARRLDGAPADVPYLPRTERATHHSRLVSPEFTQGVGYMEAIGAHAGVEFRAPFFDVPLIELCLSLPADQKMNRGRSRWAMRGAMKGILPEKVHARRTKANLEPAFLTSLRTNGRETIAQAVDYVREGRVEFLDPDAASGLLEGFLADGVDQGEGRRAWRMIALASWLRNQRSGATIG